ncbi:E3 ubiquitin-protein ligase ATL6-like [Miscanthus floridulus]|uniref:E3 ubiquitin-protein ligase ATL6-like n=1 Tax=Miscanthus floridulus TaxID=154761 RepID=UPI003459EFC0
MYAAALLAAASAAYVAAAQSPEPRDNPMIADVMSISVFMAVFFPVFVVLLAFACLRLFRAPDDDPQTPDAASAPQWPRGGGSSRKGGLDAAAIAALPLVFFREVRQHRIVDGREDDVLECSVCLLEFDDNDALRLLPTCPHSFHPECIGLWLERHSTCPLCRASVLDAPTALAAQLQTAPPPPPLITPDSSPVPSAVVLIGDASASAEGEEEDWTRIQLLARNRRAAGRQALPRSNSTGHSASDDGGMERFALRLPEHVRLELLMSHRLRHVTSSVASVRVMEGSSVVGGSVRSAMARLLSLFAPGTGWKGDGDDKSGKADTTGASSLRRRENSSRGAVGEEKRSA